MTISLSEPLVWHIVAGIIGIGAVIWRLRKHRQAVENREDLIADGWVTRWVDDPAAYAAEDRSLMKAERDAVLLVLFNVALQFLAWMTQ